MLIDALMKSCLQPCLWLISPCAPLLLPTAAKDKVGRLRNINTVHIHQIVYFQRLHPLRKHEWHDTTYSNAFDSELERDNVL